MALDLSEGVTVITGPSDSGKSNVVRAMRDALYGCRGTSHIRHGEKQASVVLESPTMWFGWEKGKKRERLSAASADGDVYDFDRADIGDALHVAPVELDRGFSACLNVQSQHDAPFLLTETPSRVAKIVGSLSGLHVLYAAQRTAQADLQTAQRAAKDIAERTRAASEEADQAREAAQRIASQDARARIMGEQVRSAWGRARQAEKHHNALEAALGALRRAKADAEGVGSISDQTARMRALSALLDQARKGRMLADALRRTETALETEKRRRRALARLGEKTTAYEALGGLLGRAATSDALGLRIRTNEERALVLTDKIRRVGDLLASLRAELSKIEVCPTCGRPFEEAVS